MNRRKFLLASAGVAVASQLPAASKDLYIFGETSTETTDWPFHKSTLYGESFTTISTDLSQPCNHFFHIGDLVGFDDPTGCYKVPDNANGVDGVVCYADRDHYTVVSP